MTAHHDDPRATLRAVFEELRAAGYGPVAIFEELRRINASQFDPPLPDEEVSRIAAAGLDAEADKATVERALVVAADRKFPLTDLGNAERLAAAHGDDVRYVPGVGWHVWDDRRFRRDTDRAVTRRMALTVRGIYAEAAGEPDPDRRKQITKHATASEAEPRLRRAIALAETLEDLIVQADQLDADPYLLNAPNGIVDLRTGELHPHDQAKLCTKLAAADHDPSAVHPVWEKVLSDVTGGDAELGACLRHAAGMTLAGESLDQKLLFAHGPGATGKTTFLKALSAPLGEYATTADFETFVARRDTGSVRSDLARLAGARMVVGVEVDEGRRLAEGVVKQLTGGDTITARFLYRDYFEFTPRFTLWLAANRRPAVDANDDAMWRRIVQIPFTHVIPPDERDATVLRTLTEDPDARAAVLAWAVRGCVEWQEAGRLVVPPSVQAYTAEYRRENDPLAGWLSDRTHPDPAASEPVSALRESYEAWAQENGERPVGARKFAESMRAHGYENHRGTGGIRTWKGIALGPPPDEPDAESDTSDATKAISENAPYARAYEEVSESYVPNVTSVTQRAKNGARDATALFTENYVEEPPGEKFAESDVPRVTTKRRSVIYYGCEDDE